MKENIDTKKEPQMFVEKLHFNDGYEMSLGHSDIVILLVPIMQVIVLDDLQGDAGVWIK